MNPRMGGVNGAACHEAAADSNVVDLFEAQLPAHDRVSAARLPCAEEIETLRELLDRGLSSEAEARARRIIKSARPSPVLLAEARCALAAALDIQCRYRDALAAVVMYETPEALSGLDAATAVRLRVQLSLAYNYTGDYPKAIALLNQTLPQAVGQGSDAAQGAVYAALGRVYRSINEYPIARDYARKALDHYRRTGDRRGLAEAYFGIGLADVFEGRYEATLGNLEQALRLIGDHAAPHLRGTIYSNMAGVCWFLKRPHDGIRFLEKAINYYASTEHTANAARGYNNLGINLILIGEWERAQEALERAHRLAAETDERVAQLPMILDSLGELRMLRGDLAEAQDYLERAVALTTEHGNKWFSGQALRTLGRCHLAMNKAERALAEGRQALAHAKRIGDRQGVRGSHLLLAEAYLRLGALEDCAAELHDVVNETDHPAAELAITGEVQRLQGLLAVAEGDSVLATHHLGRSASIAEHLGDPYRTALAHYELGRAYAATQPGRAAHHLSLAADVFRRLGARLDLARTGEALISLDRELPERRPKSAALVQLMTLRIADAVASRELLLHELAATLHQNTTARRIVIFESDENSRARVAAARGCTDAESARLADEWINAEGEAERERLALKHDATFLSLRALHAPLATLFIAPRAAAVLPDGTSLTPLLRVVELGMDVCALRCDTRSRSGMPRQEALAGASTVPGFIHSSPVMTHLVEEIHKIRSSDVTVLITGESGTGKELVARAVHAISSRHAKVFVPFNCTAVPKELSEAYLFGYRRGAFTGAVNDSPGMIRAATGGTLFLDEIGDLPLDMQPKILRFLQEGEIQPLGEQRPIQVDVRIVAATNTNLERMVAEGRFREDLYYRLNVIRLQVPPLRERRSEIPAIVHHYINHYAAKFKRCDITVTPEAVDLLMVAEWPGNVRQLCNEMQRIVACAEDGTVITPGHISPGLRRAPLSTHAPTSAVPSAETADDGPRRNMTRVDALADLEGRMIAEALRRRCGGRWGVAHEFEMAETNDWMASARLTGGGGLEERIHQFRLQVVEEALAKNDGNVTRTASVLKVSRQSLHRLLREMARGNKAHCGDNGCGPAAETKGDAFSIGAV